MEYTCIFEIHLSDIVNIWLQDELEHKKAEYAEKIKNEVAFIHKEADEKRALVEATRGEQLLKAEETAAKYRATGQIPKKHLLGCCGCWTLWKIAAAF